MHSHAVSFYILLQIAIKRSTFTRAFRVCPVALEGRTTIIQRSGSRPV